jgi:hypothetical protein
LGRLLGKVSAKRALNMTMNCRNFVSTWREVETRLFALYGFRDAMAMENTYSNVRVVSQHIFVRWRWLPFGAWRRGLGRRGARGGFVLVHLVEELEDALLLLQLNLRLVVRGGRG